MWAESFRSSLAPMVERPRLPLERGVGVATTRRNSPAISGPYLGNVGDGATERNGSGGGDVDETLGVARGCINDVVEKKAAANCGREAGRFGDDSLLAFEALRRR